MTCLLGRGNADECTQCCTVFDAVAAAFRESLQIDRFQVRLNDYGDNQFEISTQAIKTTIEPRCANNIV